MAGEITITVRCLGMIKEKFAPEGQKESALALPSRSRVRDALNALTIPEDYPLIALRNGKYAPKDMALNNGDLLTLMPPITGG